MKLNYLTIKQALELLEKKEISALDLILATLGQIKNYDSDLNSFLTVDEEGALAQAKKLDKSKKRGPLHGIPVALKDMYVTQGIETTAASKVLKDYIPQYDATAVKRLKEAGAIIIGKLNQDAWAHGGSSENSQFGVVRNPWDFERTPGGSSSGSGAALAAGMALATAGTDTGGSIRSPASYCNVVGLKPTYGRVSRYGIIAMGSSLDSIGNLGRTVWDVARYLEVVAGHDPYDATTTQVKVPAYTKLLDESKFNVKGLRIGLPKECFVKGVDQQILQAVRQAAKVFEQQGAEVLQVSLPHSIYSLSTYYVLMPSEVSSNLARYDGLRYGNTRDQFGDEAKRRIMIGTYALSSGYYEAYYRKAMQVRTLIRQDFEKAFAKIDLLLTPVAPEPPFKFGKKSSPLSMYLADIFVAWVNLAGAPALALPCGFTKNNLPIGMQLIGPQFREGLLFQAGHAYQQLTDWHQRKPKLTM